MTLYDVLGVASTVEDASLRRAYVELARRHHPDVAGGDAARMRAINDAWATLGDPARRARYDLSLTAPPAPPQRPWVDEPEDDHDPEEAIFGADDQPVRGAVRLPGWVTLIPVALLAFAALSFIGGVVLNSGAVLGLALMALALSLIFFLAAPFIALFASRSSAGDRGTAQ